MYGQQEDIEKVFNFGSTNKNDMKCKLYGYDTEADCDLSVFKVNFPDHFQSNAGASGYFVIETELIIFPARAIVLPSWCLPSTEMGSWN